MCYDSFGQATGFVDSPSASKALALLSFVAVLFVWCVLILVGDRFRAAWRASRSYVEPGSPQERRTATSDTAGSDAANADVPIEAEDSFYAAVIGLGENDRPYAHESSSYLAAEATARRRPPGSTRPAGTTARRADAFPHTKRPLPWVLAGFMALLFLVPIDSTDVKLHLPVNSHIDRFALLVVVGAWFWYGGDQRTFMNPRRSKLFVAAATAYAFLAVASLLLDAPRIMNLGDFTYAEKQMATLATFFVLGWFTLTAVRYEDLRGLSSYLIGLGCLTALGVVIERRTGYNAFYTLGGTILKPIANVAPSPTVIHPAMGSDGRVVVVGPTLNGLALAAMLTTVMPFPLIRMLDANTRRRRFLYAGAFILLLAAAMATDKKTAVVVPVGIVAYVTWYRPRQMFKIIPVGLVLLVAIVHVASPGALGSVFDANNKTSNSTQHRLGDFTNVMPDVLAHPVIGRGFGTVDPDKPTQFRINDDEYMDQVWEVGIVGLVAYMAMILAPVIAARRVIRRARDPEARSLALAASAGCIGYFVVCGLFDAMSFPQAPYASS